MGGGPTSGGHGVEREGAEGNECFEGSVDTVALDMTMKEAPDLRSRRKRISGVAAAQSRARTASPAKPWRAASPSLGVVAAGLGAGGLDGAGSGSGS
jgi:hypothetical protein